MASKEVDDLCRTLVRMELVPQVQIDVCLDLLGRNTCTKGAVLQWLEQKGSLTSYQVSRVEKGELDGLVLGGYKLMYRNASGSFARVYRACGVKDNKMIGLKLLRQRWAKDPRCVKEFLSEAELGRSLKHENIVPIYQVGKEGNNHFFTMEFVEGGNLRDFIKIRKKLSPMEATKCLIEMTEGLHYAASHGAMHRDLKMTNVLMSSAGIARLVDFGLSGARLDGRNDGGESVQRALDYATLEKGTGVQRDDPRSDLYFLGGIYYELLTGVAPLERTRDRDERSQFSRYLQVPPIGVTDPTLPRVVANLADKLMNINPTLRHQSTAEVLREAKLALAELQNGNMAPIGGAASAPSATTTTETKPAAKPAVTVMCIEGRTKHQDMLRAYFTKHGYRVLMLTDIERAIQRLKSTPPDCLLIMAESVGEDASRGFRKAQEAARSAVVNDAPPALVVMVLGEKQLDWKSHLQESPRARILSQPITLRDLRKTIKHALRGREDAEPDAKDGDEE